MKAIVVAFGVGLSSVIALVAWNRLPPVESPSRDGVTVARVEQLARDLDRIELSVGNLQTSIDLLAEETVRLAMAQASLEAPATGETVGVRAETTGARAPAEVEATVDVIERSFDAARVDPARERALEWDVTSTIRDLQVADTELEDLECRGAICRLSFLHPDGVGDQSLVETVFAEPAFSGELYTEPVLDADGTRRTLMYLAQPGESLVTNHPGEMP